MTGKAVLERAPSSGLVGDIGLLAGDAIASDSLLTVVAATIEALLFLLTPILARSTEEGVYSAVKGRPLGRDRSGPRIPEVPEGLL